jgi:ketosteroid isomerase-like protein
MQLGTLAATSPPVPDEHEALVRRIYAAWNEGETEDLGRFFADDFEYSTSGQFPGFDPVYKGPEGMLRFYEEMLSAWESFRIEMLDLEPHGEGVVTKVHFVARGHSSGVEVKLVFFHGLRFSGEKISLLVGAASAEEAIARAGLEDQRV